MDKLKIAQLHAKTKLHQHRVDESLRIIRGAIDKLPEPEWYVAFSGGKDSTVVAELIENIGSEHLLMTWDDEWLLPETEEYLIRAQQRFSDRFHRLKEQEKHADFFTSWANNDAAMTTFETFDYMKSLGVGGAFIGLRKAENSRRKIHLSVCGTLFFNKSRQMWQCNPIANWTWQDVWAFIATNNLDYNRAYDRLDEIGVEPERQRIGPLAQRRVLQYGQLSILRRGWPNLFNEFAAEFPEVRSYV